MTSDLITVSTDAAVPADLRGKLADRYAIERELGRGGMGAVYLARDLRLDRPVALKVLPEQLAADASLRERFIRETRTAASFSHPNIVPVHAIEEQDGLLAFAMGYVEGESLTERVKRLGPLDVRGVVRLIEDVGYALAYAHGRGVVHRDIKPENIMLERATGRALLMDFGISRPIAAAAAGAAGAGAGLTRVGEVVGTPEYMSPEQASGDSVDGRTDIYSLGLVALFAISGKTAIGGTSAAQILAKQLTQLPASAASLRPDLPAKVCAAIDRCVAKDPAARLPTAEALVDAIDAGHVAPEIPLAIRLFAQEGEMLAVVLFLFLFLVLFLLATMDTRANLDRLLPAMALLAVGVARAVDHYFSARRLVQSGFPAAEVTKGLSAFIEEREALRRRLRSDAEFMKHRRARVRIALVLAAVAIGAGVWAMSTRTRRPDGGYRVGVVATTVLISAFCVLASAMVSLFRNPLRAAPGERIFRAVWLGPVGRALLTRAAKAPAPARP